MAMGDEPLTRIAEIRKRLEQVREDTDALLTRVRGTVSQARDARDRETAHANVSQLRSDLDAALAEVEGLRTAMETRGVIEQAKGVLMVTLSIDEDAAFQTLVRMSQTSHKKVVEVARDVVRAGREGGLAVPSQTGERLPD